jgi:DNA repair protein RecN (Recombination protein N)
VLLELRVENLLLLDRAELRLGAGLNVLTGETGAGKTLLAHALDLLLGGRARSGIVRDGAAEAYVEGVFSLPPELASSELIPTDADELVLARRVWPDGRTRAYVCRRSVTVADLRELGSRLLAFYGQHEHRKLMLSTAQLDVLDAHCGPEQLELRARVRSQYEHAHALEARALELRELAGARERELDLLRFELDEIEAAAPSEEEHGSLIAERDRRRNLDSLRADALAAADAILPDGEGGVIHLLADAARSLQDALAIDPALGPLHERLEALRYESEDIGGELRSYLLSVDDAPGRLEEVEERLAALSRLERKHGGSIADVLEHAERCRRRIDELEHAEVALEGTEQQLAEARARLGALADELGARRRRAAPELAEAVRARLAELAMPDARFEVLISERADGCGPRGAETVELMIAPNAGVPGGPLKEAASGGELSRVMLALLSVAHGVTPDGSGAELSLLVFDEIDAGIGGHTAIAVGAHLQELARGRQILCITHLPQVAAAASTHFTIAKDAGVTPARTTVTALNRDEVVAELVRMLGAGQGDRAASQHARHLLKRAA